MIHKTVRLATLGLLAFAAPTLLAPPAARACGSYGAFSEDEQLRSLVVAHYGALELGAAEDAVGLWRADGLVHQNPGGCCHQPGTPIAEFAAHEARRRPRAQVEVVRVAIRGDRGEIVARVTAPGGVREDRFDAARDGRRWRLAALRIGRAQVRTAAR